MLQRYMSEQYCRIFFGLSHTSAHTGLQRVLRCDSTKDEITIGPARITQLIPQEFSGVTEVNSLRQLIHRANFGVKDCVLFPNRDKTGWCNFPGNYAY